MTKIAFLFSGQGSQYAEMGKELVERIPCPADLLEKIEKGEFESTAVVQPAVFAVSCAALQAAREAGIFQAVANPHSIAVGGHSLGEYAALVACGAITLEDGFKLLEIRGEIMQKAAENPENKGGMAAVLGLDNEAVEAACAEITGGGDYIAAVNYNSPGQIVVAGTENALTKAEELLKSKGAKRVLRLAVAAAFHSELMKNAAEEFKARIANFNFKMPELPFYSNVTGAVLEDSAFSNMPDYLARHICSPVRFADQLFAMEKDGFEAFVELGPGKVLSGLVKKTLPNAKVCNIEDLKSLEAAKEALL
ncbi:MAG: ACP S-malonyltransferase [Oscillospiraceae bacterium]|nr:ACP S-malonyltransferase [Oscillospiraceae bacterium]